MLLVIFLQLNYRKSKLSVNSICSVEVKDDRVSIFDTGPGMDEGEENSIVKWYLLSALLDLWPLLIVILPTIH